jgi:MerR family mercuric resistance operon transcriptional regulator
MRAWASRMWTGSAGICQRQPERTASKGGCGACTALGWPELAEHSDSAIIAKRRGVCMPSLPTLPIVPLAERSGVDIDTIKAYAQLGMLSRPRRADGLLLYPPEEVDRVILAHSALDLGFAIEAVRRRLGFGRKRPTGCAEVYLIAERHLAEIRRRRAELERIERLLTPLVETCPRRARSMDATSSRPCRILLMINANATRLPDNPLLVHASVKPKWKKPASAGCSVCCRGRPWNVWG